MILDYRLPTNLTTTCNAIGKSHGTSSYPDPSLFMHTWDPHPWKYQLRSLLGSHHTGIPSPASRPVQTCSLRSLDICRQVAGCPSTERPSCHEFKFDVRFSLLLHHYFRGDLCKWTWWRHCTYFHGFILVPFWVAVRWLWSASPWWAGRFIVYLSE